MYLDNCANKQFPHDPTFPTVGLAPGCGGPLWLGKIIWLELHWFSEQEHVGLANSVPMSKQLWRTSGSDYLAGNGRGWEHHDL